MNKYESDKAYLKYCVPPEISCPYCKAKNQVMEDLGDHPAFLSGTCDSCLKDFSYDWVREEYFDGEGDKIDG